MLSEDGIYVQLAGGASYVRGDLGGPRIGDHLREALREAAKAPEPIRAMKLLECIPQLRKHCSPILVPGEVIDYFNLDPQPKTQPKLMLNLDFKQLQDSGVGVLAEILIKKQLVPVPNSLNLDMNSLTDISAPALVKLVSEVPEITSIMLDTNEFGDAGAKVFADMLKVNKSLEEFWIGGNFTGTGINDLLEAVSHTTTLKLVEIRGTRYKPAENKEIAVRVSQALADAARRKAFDQEAQSSSAMADPVAACLSPAAPAIVPGAAAAASARRASEHDARDRAAEQAAAQIADLKLTYV